MKKKACIVTILIMILAIFSIAQTPQAHAQIKNLVVGSGGVGTEAYAFAAALTQLLEKNMKDIVFTLRTAQGAKQVVELLQRGDIQIGIGNLPIDKAAYAGSKPFNKPLTKLRSMTPMSRSYGQFIVLADSEIKTIQDCCGKRVSFGARGSGASLRSDIMNQAMGNCIKPLYLAPGESVERLKDKTIDSFWYSVATPYSTFLDLTSSHKVRFLPLPKPIAEVLVKNPTLFTVTMPAGIYPGQDYEVFTYGSMQTVVVSADVPEDLVHSMTTIIYDKIDTLRSWIATAKGLYAEDFIRFTCPLHPGALKYYKEKGYKIPANLIPPEMK